MSFYDHRYPINASAETTKSRRYFWFIIVIFSIFLLLRIFAFQTSFAISSSSSIKKHPQLRTGGTPNNNSPFGVKHEIIHDQLVEIHKEQTDAADNAVHERKNVRDSVEENNNDVLSTLLGMKGDRMNKFFAVTQKNNRKPYHIAVPRIRMFDDVDVDAATKNEKRLQKIKEEFQWAWNSYRHLAWGYDELHPVSRRPRSWIEGTKGFAMTIFDSLDTLFLMNLTKDFNDAVAYLYTDFDLYINAGCSTFEATIRLLGGTLSSYELSNDIRLLRIAEKVGWILIAGLETHNGMLQDHVNFKTRAASSMGWLNGMNLVSELGSLQLEFRTLSFHIRDPIFDMRVTHLMSVLKSGCATHGYVCPTMFNANSGRPASSGFTLGGMADSYFEYVVKQYVLTGGVEAELEKMASEMMKTISENMIIESRLVQYNTDPKDHLAWTAVFPGVWDGRYGSKPATTSLEHLTCFAGGMFALAALNMKHLTASTRDAYAQTAHDLTETCANMYFSQSSGLAPEEVALEGHRAYAINKNEYRLRPETVESIFYMWRITGDEMYREWAWSIFDAMMNFCRMPWGGYSGILDVGASRVPNPEEIKKSGSAGVVYDDLQQSYFMAETMKYLYLTFADPSLLNLEEWVFNTESHPVRIRQRDPRDVWYEWKEKHDGKPRWIAPKLGGVDAFYPELDGHYK